jgi:uncharacterized protein YbjT (DUF2867 family)
MMNVDLRLKDSMKVIITGATGMVGEGVLNECLHHPDIEKILIINRKPSGFQHSRLIEIVHPDFFNFSPLKGQLAGYDACFFCLGVSSIGMKESTFHHLTYELTMHVAGKLLSENPGMTFCYISGAGTDSTEKGRLMWARVKGKTENDLQKLGFRNVYNFRPGVLQSSPGMKNTIPAYKYFKWLIPVIRLIAPNGISTLKELGFAMINVVKYGFEKNVVEVKDIKVLAKR